MCNSKASGNLETLLWAYFGYSRLVSVLAGEGHGRPQYCKYEVAMIEINDLHRIPNRLHDELAN